MNVDVFCSCRMPATYGDMVQCGLVNSGFTSSVLASTLFHLVQKNALYINLGVLMNFTFTEYLYTMSCTNKLLQLSRHQGQLRQLQITLLDTLWP